MIETLVRVVEAFISALMVAGLYATMSYGLALIYGVMKIINLANAGIMMLAAFTTLVLWQTTGLDPLVLVVVVAPLFFVVGAVLEVVVVRRVSAAAPIVSLLLLFGTWLVMQAFANLIFGGDVRGVRPAYIDSVVHVGDVTLAYNRIFVFVAGAVILVLLELFLRGTFLGRAIRALAQDREACALVGVDTKRVSMVAFGLGSALAGAAGCLLTLVFPFDPTNPFGVLQLKSFTIIVLGGLESIIGVAFASFLLALAENLTVTLSRPQLENLVSFVVLVVVLVVMPGGLAALLRRRRLA
ncbi:MAG: branched-chain amino acid ABC transporter permease [Chloroflexi bacterium]|nr:MAG: branched-chain amino acid ABC transporter permease [Chloroflexota bacterium]